MKSHSNVETVIRPHVMAEEQRVGTNCAGPYNLAVLKVEEYEPVSLFDSAAHPAGGVWVFNVLSQRCGGAAILNFLQIAQNGRPPRTVAMLPGTTLTDPKLQRDTLRSAVMSAAVATMSR